MYVCMLRVYAYVMCICISMYVCVMYMCVSGMDVCMDGWMDG